MTETFIFRIWLKNPKEKVVLGEITTYQIANEGLFFLKTKGKLKDKDESAPFGQFNVSHYWFNINRIEKIEATSESKFNNHNEKEKFIKEVIMGIPPKQTKVAD